VAKDSLRILPEENSLRGSSPFLAEQEWELPFDNSQPRALRSLSRIIENGLCHRCGSCVGICPTGVLTVESDGYPTIKSLSSCTDCDLCVKVCPGDEFEFYRHHQALYNEKGDIESTHGHFTEATIAYATHPGLREGSTSGGLVTAILLSMLKRGEIDGAVVIASDPDKLWRGKPIIARTEAQILSAVKSKYAISPTNSVFSEIREAPGKYALVGLPCQIHGYVKAAELDQRLKERVVLTIGLFCHAAVEHQGYDVIWDSLGDKVKGARRFISRVGKHPGAPHIELEDGTLFPVYFGNKKGYRPSSMEIINILYRLYSPARCLTCFDSSSEFADIAVGDPWMAPPEDDVDFYKGWSFALIRSPRAKKVYQDLIQNQEIVSKDVTRKEALACNTLMGNEKRWRAFRIIETQRRQGKPIPSYGRDGFISPAHSLKQFLKTEINMLTHALCYIPSLRAPVMRFMLGNGGYYLLWLNSLRRRFRFWLRDFVAGVRRRWFGRS
jgi:coenzyme F420 hydrogenase subunit beta